MPNTQLSDKTHSELIAKIENVFGFEFDNKDIVLEALTHSSTTARSSNQKPNYERLEFLGDRVLGLAMADILYEHFPDEAEGDLAKRHAALVQGTTLADIAREMNLGDALILSASERQSGGALNDNILADCVESLLAALYLDKGFIACRQVVGHLWGERIKIYDTPPQDPKTELQEWAQGRGLPLPSYDIMDRKGHDHAPIFKIQVSIKGLNPVHGSGTSRRAAEKAAAQAMLQQIDNQ